MSRSAAIHDRVAAAILDAAAELLAAGGDPASMRDIAEAAGVARGTLYRYFPSREQLLTALGEAALDAISARLDQAGLDSVPVTEGIARVARAFAAVGSKYAFLVSQPQHIRAGALEERIGDPVRSLLKRGIDDGTFRPDFSADELGYALGGLLHNAARMAAEDRSGTERAAAFASAIFLNGACR
jgi:AcrR family transcriptional regulator